jgi:hypothetical protein
VGIGALEVASSWRLRVCDAQRGRSKPLGARSRRARTGHEARAAASFGLRPSKQGTCLRNRVRGGVLTHPAARAKPSSA